jgi:ketosteroid isomerase-like protein
VINLDRHKSGQIRFALTARIAAPGAFDLRQNGKTVLRDRLLESNLRKGNNRMKLLTSFLALTALSLAAAAFAQEESPSASPPDQEKASATVEASPEATKSPSETEATPSTSPAAEKKEKPAGTVTPSTKKTETETASKKAAAEPAAKSGKKMSAEATVKENENRWEAAVASHDVATIEGMVASDFMGVSSKGKFVNKSGLVSETKKDKDTYKSAKVEKLNVRSFDKDLVVVTGTAREKGTGKDGRAFDRTYLFTDTWADRNGQWQCVASQVTERGQK